MAELRHEPQPFARGIQEAKYCIHALSWIASRVGSSVLHLLPWLEPVQDTTSSRRSRIRGVLERESGMVRNTGMAVGG